jgi:UDP-4-amino-4,6-dideoxy-N-acetyl-beta-L-altrosamine transaminase
MSDKKDYFLPYGRQHITDKDIVAVTDVLRGDFITQGPTVQKFEQKLSEYCDVPHVVAVNSATTALHIAYHSLGLSEGDELWTCPNTFVATSNAALYCGATVDFVDLEPKTFNICVKSLEKKLKSTKKLPKIVVPVLFSGLPCNMEAIHALSKEYGFKIVEDASHAIGGSYKNTKTGSCAYSDITVLSFHPVKIITTGEGGACTTQDPELAIKMQELRSHGITKNPARMIGETEGGWYYQQTDLGYNYRITDIQCALGASQMDSLDEFIKTRRTKVAYYFDEFKKADLPLLMPTNDADQSSWHLFVIRIDPTKTNKNRRQLYDHMIAQNIGVNVHYIPVHLQPYYKDLGFKASDFPNAEEYYDHCLTIPLYYDLTQDEQDYIIQCLKDFFDEK